MSHELRALCPDRTVVEGKCSRILVNPQWLPTYMGITQKFSFRTLVSPPAQHLGVCTQSTRALQAHAGCCNSPLSLPHRAGRPALLLAMAGPWAPVTVMVGLRPYSTEQAKRDEEH